MNAPVASHAGERWAGAAGLASIAMLPALDAIGSLPAHARSFAAAAWVLGGVAVLAGLVVATGARRLPRLLRLVAVLLSLALMGGLLIDASLYATNGLRIWIQVVAGPHYLAMRNTIAGALGLCMLGGLFWTWRRGLPAASRAAWQGAALVAPLPLVVLAGWLLTASGSPSGIGPSTAAERATVVLVFDELDAEMIERAGPALPNLRALRSVALSATTMYPPANYTSESLPGMLSGADYDEASYTRREVYVRPPGSREMLRLAALPTLLAADPADRRKSVIGWHLPYCSSFAALHRCWDDSAFHAPGASVSLGAWLLGSSALVKRFSDWRLAQLKGDVLEYSKAFFEAPDKYRLQRIGEIFLAQQQQLLSVLAEGRSELVFAHLACPHPPALDPGGSMDIIAAYQSNLPRCDALLGEVIDALRLAGRPWQLIVTSDHWFRGRDWLDSGKPNVAPRIRRLIPFYVWLNGTQGSAWSTATLSNSRVLPSLVDAALQGRLDYAGARQLIESTGDRPTVLRPF